MRRTPVCLLVAGASLCVSAVARAQDYLIEEDEDIYSYAWSDDRLISRIGIGVSLDGGVGGFTDSDVSDTLLNRGQGVWGLRMTLGTHTPLGLDLAYVGTINSIDSLADSDADLVGTAVESALRWNILPHYKWNPYIFGGAGWQHYDITNATFSRADEGIADSDDLAIFPMGAGVSYRDTSGLTVDLRGTFRLAQDSNFIIGPTGDDVDLHTWEANASLGYEF